MADQRPRIAKVHADLPVRIAEAERHGWLGKVEGLRMSLAGGAYKLAQIDRHARWISAFPPYDDACHATPACVS
ncbi:hypothetical protein ACFQ07_00690 [Actinomadura adrarensis]|uniref:Uncharacterized protein n=1 Tax=Actinomadura adrarensis TaxID=1819600 RepID=A0ABW3C911_9ACTN